MATTEEQIAELESQVNGLRALVMRLIRREIICCTCLAADGIYPKQHAPGFECWACANREQSS